MLKAGRKWVIKSKMRRNLIFWLTSTHWVSVISKQIKIKWRVKKSSLQKAEPNQNKLHRSRINLVECTKFVTRNVNTIITKREWTQSKRRKESMKSIKLGTSSRTTESTASSTTTHLRRLFRISIVINRSFSFHQMGQNWSSPTENRVKS